METKKDCVSTSEMAELLRSEMLECLPFAHAVSGCVTASATYALEKLRAYKRLHDLNSLIDNLHIVGNNNMDRNYVIEMGEKFHIELYDKLGKMADFHYHLCGIMYTIPKYIPIARISLQQCILIPYFMCIFRGEHLQQS